MPKYRRLVGYGFLIWLIPFLVSFFIFNIREFNRPLFESIMPVVLTGTVLTFSILYLQKIDHKFLKEGLLAGVVWFIISIIIDLVLFLPESPMQMTFSEYMMDIGLTYLIILFIPIGYGYLIKKKQ